MNLALLLVLLFALAAVFAAGGTIGRYVGVKRNYQDLHEAEQRHHAAIVAAERETTERIRQATLAATAHVDSVAIQAYRRGQREPVRVEQTAAVPPAPGGAHPPIEREVRQPARHATAHDHTVMSAVTHQFPRPGAEHAVPGTRPEDAQTAVLAVPPGLTSATATGNGAGWLR